MQWDYPCLHLATASSKVQSISKWDSWMKVDRRMIYLLLSFTAKKLQIPRKTKEECGEGWHSSMAGRLTFFPRCQHTLFWLKEGRLGEGGQTSFSLHAAYVEKVTSAARVAKREDWLLGREDESRRLKVTLCGWVVRCWMKMRKNSRDDSLKSVNASLSHCSVLHTGLWIQGVHCLSVLSCRTS